MKRVRIWPAGSGTNWLTIRNRHLGLPNDYIALNNGVSFSN